MKKRNKRNKSIRLKKPLYLNANLLYGEVLNLIKKPHWKEKIKTQGTLKKLKDEGHSLVTSSLVRMEVMQNLRKEYGLTPDKGRERYYEALEAHGITEITSIDNHTP